MPTEAQKKGPKLTPKRLGSSIRKDGIHPAAYNRYHLPWACEDCSHFDRDQERCTLGYITAPHRRAQQAHDYALSGKVALCRFQEID